MHAQLHPKRLHLIGWTVLAAVPVLGEVVSWEGTSFPEKNGDWEHSTFCTPERWIEDGWMFQHLEPAECADPPSGDRDSYTRLITEFDGVPTFYVEWRVFADGDRSEIPWGAPAAFAAGSLGPVGYTFFIARDQIKFFRDAQLPILFIDLVPGRHTNRLELYGADLYILYIDGAIADSGVPEGAYPSSTPRLTWRGKSAFLESTVQWDYIRYGTIPEPGSGDFDSDGDVDLRDLYFFDECLANGGPDTEAGPGCLWADLDGDGNIDLHDFGLMQLMFTGP